MQSFLIVKIFFGKRLQAQDYLITDFQALPDSTEHWSGGPLPSTDPVMENQTPTTLHGFKTQRQVRE